MAGFPCFQLGRPKEHPSNLQRAFKTQREATTQDCANGDRVSSPVISPKPVRVAKEARPVVK